MTLPIRKNLGTLIAAICFGIILAAAPLSSTQAQILDSGISGDILDSQQETAEEAGFTTNDNTLSMVVALVIRGFLGLLGIIFIILIMLAGYNWMTAYGDESKVDKAKDTLKTSIIGLVIILAAYSITYFVFKALGNAVQ